MNSGVFRDNKLKEKKRDKKMSVKRERDDENTTDALSSPPEKRSKVELAKLLDIRPDVIATHLDRCYLQRVLYVKEFHEENMKVPLVSKKEQTDLVVAMKLSTRRNEFTMYMITHFRGFLVCQVNMEVKAKKGTETFILVEMRIRQPDNHPPGGETWPVLVQRIKTELVENFGDPSNELHRYLESEVQERCSGFRDVDKNCPVSIY